MAAPVPTRRLEVVIPTSIWPSVPGYSFTDRWPNQTVCLPDRWLHEIEQFGNKEITK
jgi:hypothetical protein